MLMVTTPSLSLADQSFEFLHMHSVLYMGLADFLWETIYFYYCVYFKSELFSCKEPDDKQFAFP